MILALALSSVMAVAQSAPETLTEDLSARKKTVSENVKALSRQLKDLEAAKASIDKANRNMENKISRLRDTKQMSEFTALQHKKDSLLNLIQAAERQVASLELKLQEVDENLNATSSRRDDLVKIKDGVARTLIEENQDYLARPFPDMTVDGLKDIKDKCQDYTADTSVRSFVGKINATMGNKSIYDNMVAVVNAPYDKQNVERAIASANQVAGATPLQEKEISELVEQLKSYPDGLAAFKEYIIGINKCRDGVDYSMEYFNTDIEQILKKNNLGDRIGRSLHKVPYLHRKFEEFMQEFNKNPNAHSKVESEILNR